MLMPRESLRDRLSRRMTENKEAKLEAAKKTRVRSERRLDHDDARTVVAELAAIDAHAAILRKQIEKRPEGTHEIATELRQLAALRNEIARDDIPPMRFPSGEPLTDRQRAFRQMRGRELKEQIWKQAARAQSEGDHRRARRCRLDALRARHLAEHEMGICPSLRGYSSAG